MVCFCIKNDELYVITAMMNLNSFSIQTDNLLCAINLQPELRSFFFEFYHNNNHNHKNQNFTGSVKQQERERERKNIHKRMSSP